MTDLELARETRENTKYLKRRYRVCLDCAHRAGCEIPNTRYRGIAACPRVVEGYLR